MTYSISNSLTATNAYLTQQSIQTKSTSKEVDSKPISDRKPNTNSVTLSAIGQQMAAQDKTWSTLSHTELRGIYDRSWDKIIQISNKSQTIGMEVFDADIPANGTPEKIAFATQIRDLMVSIHSQPQGKVANPYAGYSREALSSIIYDESGAHSTSEAFAAFAEQQKQDNIYFSKLFANNTTNNDHRQMFIGALDFHAKLSPVEQSAGAPGYEQRIGECLRQEETIFGVLSESDKKSAIDKQSGYLKEYQQEANASPTQKKTLFDVIREIEEKAATDEKILNNEQNGAPRGDREKLKGEENKV